MQTGDTEIDANTYRAQGTTVPHFEFTVNIGLIANPSLAAARLVTDAVCAAETAEKRIQVLVATQNGFLANC